MPVHDRLGGIPGLPDPSQIKIEPPPQPTPEQVAVFRAQITEQATEKRAAHDRNAEETRIIRALELRSHNLHVLFMNDLAILEANVKGPEKVDQVRGRAVLTIDINMTAVPHNPVLIWEKPCVIAATNECVDIHLDGHAPRPGELGYDPARPGRVYLEFAVPSLDEVPILAFHQTEGAIFSLTPFREIELPPLEPVLDVPTALVVPAAEQGQQVSGYDPRQDTGTIPGTTVFASGVAAHSVVPTDVIFTDVVPTDVIFTDVVPTDVIFTDVVPTDVILTDAVPSVVVPSVAASTNTASTNVVPVVAASAVAAPTEYVSIPVTDPVTMVPEAGARIKPFFQSFARLAPGTAGDVPPVLLPPKLPGWDTFSTVPVGTASQSIPVSVEGGPSPFVMPVRLAAGTPPVAETSTTVRIEGDYSPFANPVSFAAGTLPVVETKTTVRIEGDASPFGTPVSFAAGTPPVAETTTTVRVENGPSPFSIPVSLAAGAASGTDNSGTPAPVVSVALSSVPGLPLTAGSDVKTDLRVEDSVLPGSPVILVGGQQPALPVDVPASGAVPGVPVVEAPEGIVLRVEPARPEERAWALSSEGVSSENPPFLSLQGAEVLPVTSLPVKPTEKPVTVRGVEEEEPTTSLDLSSLAAAGLYYPAGKPTALFNVPAGAAEPVRERVGNDSLAREVVDLVDRLLVTAEEGSYVKELHMTMNPDVMPGTEIHMRMVGQSLTVTFVNKDGKMAKQLAAEVPALAAALRAHMGPQVDIRIVVGEDGVGP